MFNLQLASRCSCAAKPGKLSRMFVTSRGFTASQGCSVPLARRNGCSVPIWQALHEMEPNCPGFGGFRGFLSVSGVVLRSQAFFCQPVYPAGDLRLLPALGTASRSGQILALIPNRPQFLSILQGRGIAWLDINFPGRCFLPASLRQSRCRAVQPGRH